MAILRVGAWEVARRILASAPARVKMALHQATLQEAHYFRKRAVQGMREQAPGGEPFKPLSPFTLAVRKLRNFRGTKALIVRADLRNSITVQSMGQGVAFVGVLRTARGKDGQSLANVAELNEFGSRPIVIRISQKMRRFLAAVRALMGGAAAGGGGGGGGDGPGVMVVRIPARPVFGPVARKYFKPEEVRLRFLARVGRLLGGDFGQVGIPIPDGRDGPSAGGGGSGPSGGGSPGGSPPRFKDPKRVAAARLGWQRRRSRNQ